MDIDSYSIGYQNGYEDAKKEYSVKWHPYPKEKPKDDFKKYIVTTSCGEVENRWWLNPLWVSATSKVIAWAELPARYMEENNG